MNKAARRGSPIAASLALALAPSCGSSGDDGVGRGDPSRRAEVSVPAGLPRDPRIAERYRRRGSAADGWETEVLAEKALERLGELADLLARGEEGASLASPAFESRALRPANLRPVFEGRLATVWRPSGPAVSEDFRGPGGFSEALRRLVQPLGTSIQAHFKVVGVEAGEREFSTEARYEGSGRSPRGLAQQRAAWRCEWTREEGPRLRRIEVADFEEVLGAPDGRPWFEDGTEAVLGDNPSFREQLLPGLDLWTARLDAHLGLSNLGHEGLALGDVDGDGLEDLFVCQPGGLPNLLFVRNADGTATDRSAEAGVDYLDAGRSALLVDLDGDADVDLAMVAGPDLLLLSNDGHGRFSLAGAVPAPSASSMAAADVDLDGDLDLYVCGYAVPDRKGSLPVPYHDAENGRRNLLLRNEGAFRFADATAESGLEENNRRFSLAASFEDFDEDGDPDLFVANDFGRDNLYRNEGGRFRDVAAEAGVDDIGAGMGVSWTDFDGDGRLDLHVSNLFSSAGRRIVPQARFGPGLPEPTRGHFLHHARGNSLFRNLGGGRFADVSVGAGVTMGRFAWGSRFLDFDGDGREDLYVANGFVTGEDRGSGDL